MLTQAMFNILSQAIKRGAERVYDDPHLWGALQIRAARDMHDSIVDEVCRALEQSNPRFNEGMFKGASGTNPEVPATYHKGRAS